jgi:hypothetical protein
LSGILSLLVHMKQYLLAVAHMMVPWLKKKKKKPDPLEKNVKFNKQ